MGKSNASSFYSQANLSVKIPREHHRFILGKNGKKLQDLELATATKITIPRPDENSDMIRIVGTKEAIDKAHHEIQVISDIQVNLLYKCMPRHTNRMHSWVRLFKTNHIVS